VKVSVPVDALKVHEVDAGDGGWHAALFEPRSSVWPAVSVSVAVKLCVPVPVFEIVTMYTNWSPLVTPRVLPKVEQVSVVTLGDTHLWIATPVTGVTDELELLLEEVDELTDELELLEELELLPVEVDVLLDELELLLEEEGAVTVSVTNTSGVGV
jgi:hypothetical protein